MKTRLLLLICAVLLPLSLYAGQDNSHTYKASQVISDKAARLMLLEIHNASASDQYYILINATSLPSNGTVTALAAPYKVVAGDTIIIPFNRGLPASTGIVIANSSTDKSGTNVTLTIGSADSFYRWDVE